MEEIEIKERLNELILSEAYKKDFNKLLRKIHSNRNRKSLRFACGGLIPKNWNGDPKKIIRNISFAQFESTLRSPNINNFRISIPGPYLSFIDKWQVEYFFDPTKSTPFNFNPFVKIHPVSPCFPSASGRVYDTICENEMAIENPRTARSTPYKLYIGIDVRFPLGVITGEVKKQVGGWRDAVVPSVPKRKGRPKSKATISMAIRKILEKHPDWSKLSKSQQAKRISEELIKGDYRDAVLEPISIMRRYLP